MKKLSLDMRSKLIWIHSLGAIDNEHRKMFSQDRSDIETISTSNYSWSCTSVSNISENIRNKLSILDLFAFPCGHFSKINYVLILELNNFIDLLILI